jgi:uncharacterized protein
MDPEGQNLGSRVLFILATFVGALVTGIAGFAFGLIASAIWLHAITPAQSAALIAAFAIGNLE